MWVPMTGLLLHIALGEKVDFVTLKCCFDDVDIDIGHDAYSQSGVRQARLRCTVHVVVHYRLLARSTGI